MSDQIECRNYTLGRRYPMVLGRIRDVVLPWPITMPQLAAGLAGLAVMLMTRPVWRALLGPGAIAGLIVVSASVLVPVWVARPTRIEGRSLAAAVGGKLRLLVAPGRGVVAGRTIPRPGRVPRSRMTAVSQIHEAWVDEARVDEEGGGRCDAHHRRVDAVAVPAPVWSSLR